MECCRYGEATINALGYLGDDWKCASSPPDLINQLEGVVLESFLKITGLQNLTAVFFFSFSFKIFLTA